MAKALALIHGIGQKMKGSIERQECRTLEVDLPIPSSVDIEFKNITLKVTEGFMKRRTKTILKSVSGLFKSGQLTAVMGPSGAGKSSLLNALTGFSTQGVTGTIRAGNSVECKLNESSNSLSSLREYRKKSCYILQDDRLNPLFTVAELMQFAADMKLGNTLTAKLKLLVISEVLETLGLTGTENTRCGCLSGGQKKRLSIAVELIDNPPVVFLDEPTTGLDSMTSRQCMQMLKKLANQGRTIICTIHQPSASIYSMFDQAYILAEGMCIYNGPSVDTVPYFASLGLQCPRYHNPADYVLEVANCEYGNFNEILAQKCIQEDLTNNQINIPPRLLPTAMQGVYPCGRISVVVSPTPEFYKFWIIVRRCVIQLYRDWTVVHLKMVLHAFIGIILGLLFVQAGNDSSKTFSNLGFFLVCIVYLSYTSAMPAVLRFPSELPVLKKENFNNWYSLKTYYAAVLVTSVPIQICFCVVFSVPAYILSGQPLELSRYLMFVLVLVEVTILSEALGNVIGTSVNPVNGTFLGAIMICAMLLYCGFLVLFSHMSATMRVVSYMSYLRYAFEAEVLALYSFNRPTIPCPETKDYCHLRYPSQTISELYMTEDNYWTDIIVLTVEAIVIRIIAYMTLKRKIKE